MVSANAHTQAEIPRDLIWHCQRYPQTEMQTMVIKICIGESLKSSESLQNVSKCLVPKNPQMLQQPWRRNRGHHGIWDNPNSSQHLSTKRTVCAQMKWMRAVIVEETRAAFACAPFTTRIKNHPFAPVLPTITVSDHAPAITKLCDHLRILPVASRMIVI